MREALLSAAARQFAARGVAGVSVAELLHEADISRATFYQFFSSKYGVLESILNPAFDAAIRGVQAVSHQSGVDAMAGLVGVYCELWCRYRGALLLIPDIDPLTFKRFAARHAALNTELFAVLAVAERAGVLRNGDAHLALKVLARTAIPLLRVHGDHADGMALFADAMGRLLLVDGIAVSDMVARVRAVHWESPHQGGAATMEAKTGVRE